MLQTVLGNLFIGGLLLFSILALLLPIFVETQKRLSMPGKGYLKRSAPVLLGLVVCVLLIWALAT